ncbi:DUF4064 domain-containing protein [Clostridium guangxiense]|uniref:DUF4064 domain-containing protein n=1 Tax=Clostridium guangxiense TaxID=1662055 RepID=UPI001E494317|nr:DUF4064 domain-containing protein [Clostridium guangxiense]MCD2346749.1 hypothetical protein [Clostridium guangxiense]
MNRKFEKILAYIGGTWQILSGLITIIPYSSMIKRQGFNVTSNSQLSINATQSVLDSIYSFSTTIGILFLAIGLFNLYLSKRLRNMKVEKKIPIWFITCGIVSFFVMDFISCVFFISSGVIAMAKNKSLRIMNN